MNSLILIIGIVLLVIGLIGLAYNFAMTWMWIVAILGVIGIVWGIFAKGKM